MYILIAGGTGFIGKQLTDFFIQNGHHVYILTRNVKKRINKDVSYLSYDDLSSSSQTFDVIINLAGESLYGYWTKSKKKRIYDSRIETTEKIYQYVKRSKSRPHTFISSSAVGYYGTSFEKTFTEDTPRASSDFLTKVVADWEKTAQKIQELGVRTIHIRLGIVLCKNGGALPLMSLPVKFLLGGKIGSGNQWISWIHLEDVIRLIDFCIKNQQVKGAINGSAPYPEQNHSFMKKLAISLNKPYWLPVPKFLIKLLLGEMSELILSGQRVLPQKAMDLNFQFSYPKLEDAFRQIYQKDL